MNRGLITGRVFYANGRSASNIYVKITSVDFGNGSIQVIGDKQSQGNFTWRSPESTTDARGRFSIPFFWSGSEFAEDVTNITINIVAFNNPVGNSTASGRFQVSGYLFKDIQALL